MVIVYPYLYLYIDMCIIHIYINMYMCISVNIYILTQVCPYLYMHTRLIVIKWIKLTLGDLKMVCTGRHLVHSSPNLFMIELQMASSYGPPAGHTCW